MCPGGLASEDRDRTQEKALGAEGHRQAGGGEGRATGRRPRAVPAAGRTTAGCGPSAPRLGRPGRYEWCWGLCTERAAQPGQQPWLPVVRRALVSPARPLRAISLRQPQVAPTPEVSAIFCQRALPSCWASRDHPGPLRGPGPFLPDPWPLESPSLGLAATPGPCAASLIPALPHVGLHLLLLGAEQALYSSWS